jgi:predicted nucleic acid-binding protein
VTLVLDSSIALAWHFEDEQTQAVRAVLLDVAEGGAVAPGLWRFEVANGLQMALRRGRIDAALRDRALGNLAALNVEIDEGCDVQVWSATVRLADLYRLTVYDAAYLELAQRTRCPLATLDAVLATAARAAGVTVRPA